MTRYVLILLFLFAPPLSSFAQPQAAPAGILSEDEYRRKDLEIRYRAAEVENNKAWMSALATGVPILAGLLALAGTIWAARRALVATFTTKAVELAIQGEGPEEVINRATLLGRLYKDLLPKDFLNQLKQLEPKEVGRIVTQAPWVSDLKKEVVALLAQYPTQRQQIIEDYKILYKQYAFFDELLPAKQVATDTSVKQKKE